MWEIIAYNILFWGALIGFAKFIENGFQLTIDNWDKLKKKGN